MIEVFGKDGRVFRFQDGTSEDVIVSALNKHYAALEQPLSPQILPTDEAPQPQVEVPVAAVSAPIPPAPIDHPSQPNPNVEHDSARTRDDRGRISDEETAPSSDPKAMNFALTVGAAALGVLAVTGVLWSTGVIGKKAETTAAVANALANTNFTPTPQPDMRQAVVATQIRKEAKSDGAVLKEMIAGSTLDVLGEQTISGTNWVRVRVDQVSGDVGYVIASHLGSMAPALDIVAGGSGGTAPTPPITAMPPGAVVGNQPAITAAPIETRGAAIAATTYFVVSRELNVRSGASPGMRRVGVVAFGTPLVATEQANFQGRIWLKVRSNNGISGWVNSDLVSLTPAAAPIDQQVYAAPPPGRVVYSSPQPRESMAQDYSSAERIRVTALNANIRSEPSAQLGNDSVIDVAPLGDVLTVSAGRYVNGKLWYRVRSNKGITGWISASNVMPDY
jgi:uncharacterized protein YgiM (DUF1202 family)